MNCLGILGAFFTKEMVLFLTNQFFKPYAQAVLNLTLKTMMEFIVNLLVSAGVLMVMAYIMPQVTVKSFTTALGVALLVGILNATIGWVLGGIFNLFTLFLLSFIVKLVVSALMIK